MYCISWSTFVIVYFDASSNLCSSIRLEFLCIQSVCVWVCVLWWDKGVELALQSPLISRCRSLFRYLLPVSLLWSVCSLHLFSSINGFLRDSAILCFNLIIGAYRRTLLAEGPSTRLMRLVFLGNNVIIFIGFISFFWLIDVSGIILRRVVLFCW